MIGEYFIPDTKNVLGIYLDMARACEMTHTKYEIASCK